MKRILITGANGFIGTNFILKTKEIYDILAISTKNNNICNIENIKFSNLILSDYNKINNIIDNFKPDVILHLAWEGANSFQSTNSIDQYNNIKNSFYLLEAIVNSNCHFIGMGSGAEYGCSKNKLNENDLALPTSHYGMAKLLLKQSSEIFCKSNYIPWTWVRPIYFYGNYDVKNRLIPKVINKCLNKEKIILDSCTSSIDYLHIDDAVNALIQIIESKSSGLFNICSGQNYEIRNLMKKIMMYTNWYDVTFDKNLDRNNFCKTIIGNNEKIKNTISWLPKKNIEEGLYELVQFQMHNT